MNSAQEVRQRFGIIGSSGLLDRALTKAMMVAPTDISVLVTGESGVGKESIPRIIHQLSHRKHKPYIAVNCGAIPEGTIDSELFGHEKGSFTGATGVRKGYFEEADGGTIFLDEVGELPLSTQVRLLRVLETGEFIKVGSSKIQKTDVRIVAATNLNMVEAVEKNRFREDLYYRLNTVEIHLPPLRERPEDVHLLFRKFAQDFAEKYKLPAVRLDSDAVDALSDYRWPGNIRQLRNLVEQLSVLETERSVSRTTLEHYLPQIGAPGLPMALNRNGGQGGADFASEREILYKILFDMRNDLNDLKQLTHELMKNGVGEHFQDDHKGLITRIYEEDAPNNSALLPVPTPRNVYRETVEVIEESDDYSEIDEVLSLEQNEIDMIRRSLEKHRGKRKEAAQELGISERTLYRKIKHYGL
ncbi:AAA domain-containing protein [bacterium]|nr:AAA domain-containing protein [bacterium]